MSKHIFLSYSNRNNEFVENLRSELGRLGFDVWIDTEGLSPGTLNWEYALRLAIRDARAVVLIASPESYDSRYVQGELEVAKMYGCPIFPVWASGDVWGNCVPLEMIKVQYADMRGPKLRSGLDALVKELNKLYSNELLQQPYTVHPIEAQSSFIPRNPYKGLHAFTNQDTKDFFGREKLISELMETLRNSSFLALIGASGSGKSSLVMAGLLPQLQADAMLGSKDWVYLEPVLPGTDPIESLAISLANALGSSVNAVLEDLDRSAKGLHLTAKRLAKKRDMKVILLVDQFEELFTQTVENDKRNHFIDLIVTAATEVQGNTIVIITLRADLYDRPMNFEKLGRLIEQNSKLLLPMTLDELRQAIERPAQQTDVQIRFEEQLVGDLIYEIRGESGALPLLQFTLDQLFRNRKGQLLSKAVYEEIGGLKGALATHAEATFVELPTDKHRDIARTLFLRLVEPQLAEQEIIRRRMQLVELDLADEFQNNLQRDTLDLFINARLLTVDDRFVSVTHEALIREWPRLTQWVRIHRDDLRTQNLLSRDVFEWSRRGKTVSMLYRGERLLEVIDWARRNSPSTIEEEFIHSSIQAEQRELEQSRDREDAIKRLQNLRENLAVSLPHEFRTPLTGILGFSDLLMSDASTMTKDRIVEMAKHINANGYRLYRLVEKFLSYSRLLSAESDEVNRRLSYMGGTKNPRKIIREISVSIASEAKRENDLEFASDDPVEIRITPEDFTTIVRELVENAFKFSHQGGKVFVSLNIADKFVSLTVKDHGRGMTPEQIAHQGLFMQFERRIHEQQGAGIGLTIARKLTELYSGQFEIESEVGKFTEVRVTIPIA